MNSLYSPDMIKTGARQEHQRLTREAHDARQYRNIAGRKQGWPHETARFHTRDLAPAIAIAALTVFVALQAAFLVAI